ncbi:MAG: nuclease [Sphingomonas sp.]|uniref:thermonuclease family protein n=1 Tax=Sphingomonas sp. TaxID=28214 RepID=UPI001B190606|nr:nuclease [Sphingomonas sp.]MBO9621669.1 nuclease [Sphingomonas sp.]
MPILIKIRFAPAILVAWAAGAWAPPALADSGEGSLPASGTTFSEVVRWVGDGDGLCIGPAGQPSRWIEGRLADFYAPELHDPRGSEAKRRLERLAMGRTLVCRALSRSYDRVVATCTLGGRSLGAVLRGSDVSEGGRGRPRRS